MVIIMKKNIMRCVVALLAVAAPGVYAEAQAPDVLIKNTAQEVLAIVKQDKDIQAGNQKRVLELVDAKVLPHFNFTRMTRLAVGKHWRTATEQQKKSLESEFRNMLVRTYTKAFTLYKDVDVETKSLKVPADATEVTVKTMILRPGAPPIPVNYEMEKTDAGWKAFDLSVEGVSLVATHRGSFAEKVQQSGIDGLIKSLIELNKGSANTAVNKAESK